MQLFELIGKITIDQLSAVKAITDVEKQADKSGSNIDAKFSKIGGLFKGAFLGAAGLAATAVAGIGIAGLKGAGELETATDRMQGALRITEEEAKRLGTVSTEVFRNGFGGSVTEAAGMVQTLRQQLGQMSDEQTSKLTQMAATISDVYGADYAQTINTAKTLTDQFGLSNEQAFDFIATGFQKGLDSSGDFLDSVNEYGTQFANGGASADEFFGIMESGLQGGMLGTDKAADAFKEFRLRIQDGSTLTKDSLAQIGISADDMAAKISSGQMTAADAFQLVINKLGETTDPMVRMQAGAGLIGTQFEDLGDTAVQQLSMTTTSLNEMKGATDAAGKAAYDNLGSQMTTLWRTLQTSATTALTPLIPMISDFVGVLIEKAPLMIQAGQSVAAYIERWSPQITTLIGKIGPVVTDIFGLMAAAWTNVVKPVWDTISPYVSGLFGLIAGSIKAFKLILEGDFSQAWVAAITGLKSLLGGLGDTLDNIFYGLWGFIEQPLIDLKTSITTKATEIKEGFLEHFDNLKHELYNRIGALRAFVALPLSQLKGKVVNTAIGIYNQFKGYFEDLEDKLVEIVGGFWNAVKIELEAFTKKIVKELMGIPDRIGDLGRQVANKITEGMTGAKNIVVDASVSLADSAVQAFKDTFQIRSPSKVLYTIGQQVVQGLTGGVSDPAELGKLEQKAGDMAATAMTAVKRVLKGNPLHEDAAAIGESIVNGLIAGFNRAFPGFSENLNRVLAALRETSARAGRVSGYQDQMGQNDRNADSAAAIRADTEIAMMQASGVAYREQMRLNTLAETTGLTNREMARKIALDTELAQRQAATTTATTQMQTNAANEAEARRIMLDTENAQRQFYGAQAAAVTQMVTTGLGWAATGLTGLGTQLQTSILGLHNDLVARQTATQQTNTWFSQAVGWVGTTLQNAATWVGSTLTAAASWVGEAAGQIGWELIKLAAAEVPGLGAAMSAMAGGPIAMLVAFFVDLIGSTWQFQAIIDRATSIMQPLIGIAGDLITALWPLIQVALNLMRIGLQPVIWSLQNVVNPVFGFVARTIASVWNALAGALNSMLGWLGVNIPRVDLNAGPTRPSGLMGGANNAMSKLPSPADYAKGAAKYFKDRSPTPKDYAKGAAKMLLPPKSKPPKAPKYKAPKQPKAPSMGKPPKSPGYKAPGDGPGRGKAPKSPGYKSPGYTPGKGGSSGSDMGKGSGGTKVSEITGPTRDFLADAFASFVALPQLVGIGERTFGLLNERLGAAPIQLGGPALAGGPVITNHIHMVASGNLAYDADQLTREVSARLAKVMKTNKRGSGG